MSANKEFVQFKLEDGTSVLIEVEKVNTSGVQRVALTPAQMAVQAKQSFEQALATVPPVASSVLNRLRKGMTEPADEIEVKFGLKMTSEVGAVIASVGGEVNFEVTLKWQRSSKNGIAQSGDD